MSPDFLGSPSWVSIDTETSKLTTIKDMDQNSLSMKWILSKFHSYDELCVKTLAGLCNKQFIFPQKKYLRLIEQLNIDLTTDTPPWWQIIPKQAYRDSIHELTRDIVSVFVTDDVEYYMNIFRPTRDILDDLVGCHIDMEKYTQFLSQCGNESNSGVLTSFQPNTDGICKPIKYDIFGSRTGRLTIESGPNILTLKKEYREMLKSRWSGGKIVMLDFSSLEARILAYEAGIQMPDDIYSFISSEILNNVDREIAKITVISTLYGGGISRLSQYVDADTAHMMVNKINDLFRTRDLIDKLRKQHESLSYIRNFYGRRVQTQQTDHVLINSYTQSTGVDVALLGFSNVLKTLKTMNSKALFVLADALILDIHPDEFQSIEMLKSACEVVTGYQKKFPVKVSEISTSNLHVHI
jgi:hypothetical protein